MESFKKFFLYFYDEGILGPYNDHLGKGFFDYRHFLWLLIVVLLVVFVCLLKDKKKMDKIYKFNLWFLGCIFVVRFINFFIRFLIKVENPAWRAIIPLQYCTMFIYLIPIVTIFNIKGIRKQVYYMSVLGGVITMFSGEYFESSFLTFSSLEGMIAHTMMVVSSIFLLKYYNERFSIKDFIKLIYLVIVTAGIAFVFDVGLTLVGRHPNYFYLSRNMLPFGGKYFIFAYMIIFLVLYFIVYLLTNYKTFDIVKKELKENKIALLLNLGLFFFLTVFAYTVLSFTVY